MHRLSLAAALGGLLLTGAPAILAAQEAPSPGVTLGPGGIVFRGADSAYRLTLRFRVQSTLVATSEPDETTLRDLEWTVRRARLHLSGTVADPRLAVLLQLGLARRDQDQDTWGFPVIVRDAFATWRWSRHFRTGFGVTKLPGNRQRVNSSADLVFPERSIVNNTFTLDRDFGLQAYLFDTLGTVPVHVTTALSSGRGRGATAAKSAALTGRLEVLPLGGFLRGNDYVEGGFQREPRPRVALGLTAQRAWNTNRTGVSLGSPLFGADEADVTTVLADGLLKWDRFTLSYEYAHRSGAPVLSTDSASGRQRFVTVGDGLLLQSTVLLARNVDLAVRAAWVWPGDAVDGLVGAGRQRQFAVALTRYLRGHRVKVQTELGRLLVEASGGVDPGALWIARLSTEVGL